MSNELRVDVHEQHLRELLAGERDSVRVADSVAAPNTTPIIDVEMDETYDLLGIVRSVGELNEFDRSDGDTGQVRNIRIQDRTSDLRCALWGEHADKQLQVGDAVHLTDVDVEDGYQDTLEGSVGWESTVMVVDNPDEDDTYVTITIAEEEDNE